MDYMEISAPIFNIQTFCIHDGPGIRVTVFVKGCPLHCLWCSNPESNNTTPQLMTYKSRCTGCGECVESCPEKAISIVLEEGKAFSVTDRDNCVNCGVCVPVCRAEAREIVGKVTTVAEVLKQILQDKLFMDGSGGGMTISGGEALAHPDFSRALLRACRENGVRTAIETCVFAERAVIDKVFEYVDLGLLDIKHMDSETHKKLTGVPNEKILDNIKHIYHDLKVPVVVRVPVITGYNDDAENIRAVAWFTANELGKNVPVNLLPYHRLGESKNESLGKSINLSIDIPSGEYMEKLKQVVESYGLDVRIGG